MVMCYAAFVTALLYILECNGIGRICRSGGECPDGQYCILGKCLCFNGQVLMNDKCVLDFYCLNGKEVYHNGQCYYLSTIGDKCLINEQCYGESSCLNNSCICLNGTVNVNGLCVRRNVHQCEINQVLVEGRCLDIAIIGGTCQMDAQCSGGASCLNQHCSCPSGTIQDEQICAQKNCSENEVLINGTCLSLVIPGEQCVDSSQCLDGSECSPSTRACICLEGMNNIGGYCRKLSHTDPCDSISLASRLQPSSQDCVRELINTDVCFPPAGHCFVRVYVNDSCVPIRRPGDQCSYDLQCLSGSICTDGHCNCPQATTNTNGYCSGSVLCNQDEVFLNNRCFKRVTFNKSCLISDQCPNNAICNYAAQCACPIGMTEINGRCESSQISYCKNIEVLLADGQFQVNGQCVKRRVPGATCIANEQCLDESNCSNGYCRCANDTVLLSRYCVRRNGTEKCDTYQTYVNGKCLDLAIPGEVCINDLQCVATSTCRAGKCVCPNGYFEVKKYCVRDFRSSTECNNNQILINGYCYDFAKIGQYCIDTVVCLGSSICYNNYCTCPGGTVAQNGYCQREEDCLENEIRVDGKCYPRVNIGQDCQFTQQCVSISTCQNGICICPPGTVSQNNICVPSGPCPTGQIYNAESCWDIAYIGEQCEFTQQCQGYSICIGGTCQCPDDTVVQDGLCIKEQCNSNEIMIDGICFNTAKIDDFCYYTKQCQGNATCRRGKCTCPSGTVNSNDTCIVNPKCQSYQIFINDSCLDTVSIGMTCRDNSQCIESASCVAGKNLINSDTRTCQCNNGTIFTGSKCLISPLQCPMSTVYIAGTICYPLVDIGQFCLYTIQCMGNSICSGQICKCPLGYSIIHNVCRRIN